MAEAKAETENTAEEAASNAPAKAGVIDRATELFILMAVPAVLYFFWDGKIDLSYEFIILGFLIFLSLIGGLVTAGKPPAIAAPKEPTA
jgi:hypothetical protein